MTDLERYDVVLLVEQTLSPADAAQVHSLHEALEVPVTYHVLIPVEDAAARVEAAMGTLTTGELTTSPALTLSEVDLAAVREEGEEQARTELRTTLERLSATGAQALGALVDDGSPIDALEQKVREVDAGEVIVLTRPHVVAELFRLDWSSQARRKLGVPVLHLLEHETFAEQAAGEGEGATGL